MAAITAGAAQEWAVLFYLCGHFNRPGERDPFLAVLDEIQQVTATPQTSAAVYLDLESGARRMALRAGGEPESEFVGAMNSGDPRTLEAFLSWAFDACPAKRYILVMAGLGILDADSVVGRPPFDTTRTFSICDDRATDDAIELHELRATLQAAFPEEGARRLVLLACDMYAMQFMEVAYELQPAVDFLVGIQPDERQDQPALRHWPYAKLMRRWQELAATRPADALPRWRTGVDPHGELLARETVAILAEHYGSSGGVPVTVSALNLYALTPLAQALDTFSVVYLQWLSNDVMWRARERVFSNFRQTLESAWSYDLDVVATAVGWALDAEAAEALVHWAAETLPLLAQPRLADALRVLGTAAREVAVDDEDADACNEIAARIAKCRSTLERAIAASISHEATGAAPSTNDIAQMVKALFADPAQSPRDDNASQQGPNPMSTRHARTWSRIITHARARFAPVPRSELTDIVDGIEAARQIGRLAARVAELVRASATPADRCVVAVWPANGRCGLSLYRPVDLDKLAESNYLNLRFSRELHWTALLTAVDLINNHARMLWRLVESQLTAAPLEARYQLMQRLAGARALTGRHADQLRALSAPDALFLSIEPIDASLQRFGALHPPGADLPPADAAVVSYCVRLNSLDRSATVVERRNPVPRERLERVLTEIDAIGSNPEAEPASALERLACCGSLLGDDILYGIGERLAEVASHDGRPIHLVLQMPRELMRYPWELLRDRHGWLVERFALGRQVISDADSIPRWSGTRRRGSLRFLVVAPAIGGSGAEVSNVGILEGEHVASCFERLQERLPGLVEPTGFRDYIDTPVTVERFRTLLREGRFDIVHFAGHGRYDPVHPERSCWMFSDGALYAFELRHTLANADVTPWLLYGSACEGSREAGGAHQGYHDGVYGMASAALGQGVAAYVGPLWKIAESDAKNLAADFYEALLLRRTSIGEALAFARRRLKSEKSAAWTGMVLYGDPTPTVLQRLSPSEPEGTETDHEDDRRTVARTREDLETT